MNRDEQVLEAVKRQLEDQPRSAEHFAGGTAAVTRIEADTALRRLSARGPNGAAVCIPRSDGEHLYKRGRDEPPTSRWTIYVCPDCGAWDKHAYSVYSVAESCAYANHRDPVAIDVVRDQEKTTFRREGTQGCAVMPRVAVRPHLDGDPKPRPDEIAEWNAERVRYGLDVMVCVILLPTSVASFSGYEMHGWEIRERSGEVLCRRADVRIPRVES